MYARNADYVVKAEAIYMAMKNRGLATQSRTTAQGSTTKRSNAMFMIAASVSVKNILGMNGANENRRKWVFGQMLF
jgi:hypothetical protein